ncbi:hypothetical protein NC652_005487 [Populus alba x Populus x berolinensis]|uniref:Uncharacterized protein n=1 Tax=Populus alba x Populus x berolinensis TaxID=444605 RepID=A0AAD6RBZ6_9ROSI|nr:hypothetical protein NC652_005487 [Populus alba x Populus x berolinensis]KAJ7006133.1 hypothetical protein NC653_005477 [Populus alba x Populus x berolinensis]
MLHNALWNSPTRTFFGGLNSEGGNPAPPMSRNC